VAVSTDTIIDALHTAGLLVDRRGELPREITGVWDDSRQVERDGLFIAVRGTDRDGHDYLKTAAAAGATAAIVELPDRTELPAIVVRDGRRAAAIAASAAHGWPARDLMIVGVTGTNGKTTTVNMLRHLLDEGAKRSASIGTLGVLVGSAGDAPSRGGGSGLTTPGPVELQRIFRQLVDEGVARVAMEVSSHALEQHRVEGVELDVAIFTNLTRDHLDCHVTMDAYFGAKSRLVGFLRPHGTLVVNLDDQAWSRLPPGRRRVGFSERDTSAEVHAEGIRYHSRGSEWTLALADERHGVTLPLIGDFNIINALGAAAGAWALGTTGGRIADRLSTMPQVPGRLELLSDQPTVLRDYAHTPDALARALDAVRPFARRRLIAVFGCGGDRDRGKRPEMGAIAASKADLAIATSDNPRTEDPERILDDIEAGMEGRPHERIEDRRAAIDRALDLWEDGDVIILAGKGHETYQVRGTEKLPFDEKIVVGELVAARADRATSRAASRATEG
jgi:UDP-N-acetylmuramoyl-L-alanyl-D-glutamate--2,6-diaminopimelate ligase